MGSGNCDPLTYTELKALSDKTVDQIKASAQLKKQFNPGLYIRSLMMGLSKNTTVDTVTPLKFLNPFFALELYYPQRQTLTIEMDLKSDQSILVVKGGKASTDKYKLVIEDIYLNLKFATWEPKLRESWLNTISTIGLRRNIQVAKQVHFPIKATSTTARFASLFNFSVLPSSLSVIMLKEATHTGDFLNTPFCYKHFDLQSITLFKSGVPFYSNLETINMDLSKRNGVEHVYWYRQMLECYGKKSSDMSMEKFFEDFYVLSFNLSSNPRLHNDFGVVAHSRDRKLSFLEAGNLDCNLTFKTALDCNVLVFFIAWFDIISSFDPDGNVIDE